MGMDIAVFLNETIHSASVSTQRKAGIAFADTLKATPKIYLETNGTIKKKDIQLYEMLKTVSNSKASLIWAYSLDSLFYDVEDIALTLDVLSLGKVKTYIDGMLLNVKSIQLKSYLSLRFDIPSSMTAIPSTITKKQFTTRNRKQRVYGILGYDYYYDQLGNLIPKKNKEEAETIEWIYKVYQSKQLSFKAIADQLNAEQVNKTKRKADSLFYSATIRNILRRPEYCGLTFVGNKEEVSAYYARVKIIEENDWKIVQKLLEKNSKSRGIGKKISKHELHGLLYCSKCEAQYCYREKLTYFHKTKNKKQRECDNKPKYARADDYEAMVAIVFTDHFPEYKSKWFSQSGVSRRKIYSTHIEIILILDHEFQIIWKVNSNRYVLYPQFYSMRDSEIHKRILEYRSRKL